MKLVDIYWVAGILEGEGAFCAHGFGGRIMLSMTDRDVVERVAAITGTPSAVKPVQPRGSPSYLPQFRISIGGRRAIEWMMTLYPILSQRKQTKVREILARWKQHQRKSNPVMRYYAHLLGTMSDVDLARRAGCAVEAVAHYRRQHLKPKEGMQ